jgi:hypothetical protein
LIARNHTGCLLAPRSPVKLQVTRWRMWDACGVLSRKTALPSALSPFPIRLCIPMARLRGKHAQMAFDSKISYHRLAWAHTRAQMLQSLGLEYLYYWLMTLAASLESAEAAVRRVPSWQCDKPGVIMHAVISSIPFSTPRRSQTPRHRTTTMEDQPCR